MFVERIKFYADTPRGEKNKFFCFSIELLSLEQSIKNFLSKGFNIRALWYEKTNTDTGEVENTRIKKEHLEKFWQDVLTEKGINKKSSTRPNLSPNQ